MASRQERLELLKLTYTHGRAAQISVEHAREMERYLDEIQDSVKPAPATEAVKKTFPPVAPQKVGNPRG